MVAITYKYHIFRLLVFRLKIFTVKNTTLYTYIRHYVLYCTHIILLLLQSIRFVYSDVEARTLEKQTTRHTAPV